MGRELSPLSFSCAHAHAHSYPIHQTGNLQRTPETGLSASVAPPTKSRRGLIGHDMVRLFDSTNSPERTALQSRSQGSWPTRLAATGNRVSSFNEPLVHRKQRAMAQTWGVSEGAVSQWMNKAREQGVEA